MKNGLHDLELTLSEDLNPVAQLSGPFKLKPLRRRAHLYIQPSNRRFEISRRVVFNLVNLGRNFEVISFRRRNQRRLDRLHDRLRGDAVLAIKNLLNGTPPLRLVNRAFHRVSHSVSVKYRLAASVARRTS